MKKLLIVVDFQNDFVDGSLGFDEAKILDQRIYDRINFYRNNQDDVIFTFDTHYEENYFDTVEGKHLPIKHCIKNSVGHQLYGKTRTLFDKDRDLYFEKVTFPSLDLANYLKDKSYDSVELCGLVSNICVLSNAIMVKAALPNCEIYVDKNLTSSADELMNQYGMKIMEGLHINVK